MNLVGKMIRLLFFFACFLAPPSGWSEEASEKNSPESVFTMASGLYAQGKLEDSFRLFQSYLKMNPNDARAHLNVASISSKLNRPGVAWAHLRKAKSLTPNLPGLSSLEAKLGETPPPALGLSGPFHRWIRPTLASLNQNILGVILILSATAFVHLIIRYQKRRSWAKEADEALPQISWTTWTILLLSLILGISLVGQSALKNQTYASIAPVEGEVLKSVPGEDGLEVGRLPAGVEIKVLREQNDWVQITNERGTSGWVPKDSVLIYPGAPQ